MSDAPNEITIDVNGVKFAVPSNFATMPADQQNQIKEGIRVREGLGGQPYGQGTRLTYDEPPPANESDIFNPETAYTPSLLQQANQRAGQFASGINRDIAKTAGMPVDLATGAINLGFIEPTNALYSAFKRPIQSMLGGKPAAAGPSPDEGGRGGPEPVPNLINPITAPIGGSEMFERGMDKLGLLSPQPTDADPTGQYLQATGAGVGSALTGSVYGRGMRAATDAFQQVPRIVGRIGDTLSYGSKSVPSMIANTAVGAAGGAGAQAGTDIVSNMTDDPTARQLGGMTGNLVGGGVLATAATAAKNSVRAAAEALRPANFPLTGGRRALAGRVLQEAAGENFTIPAGNIDRPLNASLTPGELFNNAGLMNLERMIEQNVSPHEAANFANQRAAINQTLVGNMERIGQTGNASSLNDASQVIDRNLRANWENARVAQSTAHKNINPERNVMFPTAQLKTAYKEAVDNLEEARKPFVPTGKTSYGRILNGLPDYVPIQQLTALRTTLGNAIRRARDEGNHDRANVLKDLDNALYQRVDAQGGAPVSAHEQVQLNYQEAQRLSRLWHKMYNEGQMGEIFETSRGQPKVQPSNVAEHILGTGDGQLERVNQFVAAANDNPATAEQTLGAARNWFMTKMRLATAAAKQDTEGDQFLQSTKLRNFVDNNRGVIDSNLLTQDQRDLIDEIVTTVNMADRTMRSTVPGTSNTAQLLTGGNYLRNAIGGTMQTIVNLALRLGSTAAGAAVDPTLGVVGGIATSPVVKNAYERVIQKTIDLVGEGVRNPEAARDLMAVARNRMDPSQLSPRIAQLLAGLNQVSGTVLPTTDRPKPVYDLAADMVRSVGPGQQVTREMLEQATGMTNVRAINAIRQELISKGLLNREGGGMYRRSQPSSPNSGGPRSELENPHPLRESAYRTAQAFTPTLRGSTFDEITQDIEGRESPLHGQYAPGGLYEQLARGHATHETVELAKRARVFDPADWRVLAGKANNWVKQFDIDPALPATVRRDEAVATAYNRWQTGELQLPPGLRRIFSNYYDFSAGVA